jgi:putative acetyltransferase
MALTIRKIEKKDNLELAKLIRTVFREFKIDREGTVFTDPSTDYLFELFEIPNSCYWIAEENGKILGGCGIYPTKGLPKNCVELVKFYLSPESRGKGVGRKLMDTIILSAKDFGYKQLYLESFPELSKAVDIYKKEGFVQIEKPYGCSGHHACTIWMLKNL